MFLGGGEVLNFELFFWILDAMLIDENFVDVFFTKWMLKSTEMTWFDKFYFEYYLYTYAILNILFIHI